MRKTWVCVAIISLLAVAAEAAEKRIWMSRKGGTVEAELGSLQGDSVSLINNESKEIKLKIEDLSLADRQYLMEYAGADASIIASGKPGLVEKEVRLDSSTFKKIDGDLTFPDLAFEGMELFESTHFLVASAGSVRPQAIAETAERLWHGMAFQHMNFRRDWGDKRMLILLVEDRETYASLGGWVHGYLMADGNLDAATRFKATWDETGSTTIPLPDDMIEKFNLSNGALVFNIKDAGKFRKDLSPFPTHSIAARLLAKQMGGVSTYGGEGYFSIVTGHAYFKEISLTGKSETSLLTVEGTGNDEIGSKRGFDDGTSWARTLKPLVRSGKMKVDLEEMLKWESEDLNPERLVLIYSFAYYMESDWKRLASFAKMVRRIEVSNQIPPAAEIATIFGFESIEAFNEDWTKFIKEGDFK